MKIGILTRNEDAWCSTQLRESLNRHNVTPLSFNFFRLTARVGIKPAVSTGELDLLSDLNALIIRPIGLGSLEEIIFRMDLLHRLERLGLYILNPPSAIERSVDKFYTLTLLGEAGLPVPHTIVTESAGEALEAFEELGGDIVLKPLFGSRGIGSTRIFDRDIAERIFRSIEFRHGVLYLQKFVSHGTSDIRVFTLGDRVLVSMRRVADSWKTNVSQGAKPEPLQLSEEMEDLAVKVAEAIGCEVAGVDILESKEGLMIIEINSQPGWRGLQSVTKINIADEIVRYILKRIKK